EPVDLRFRRRKPRKTRIVAICDVSGSMDLYSRFLLQFLYALQGTVARVESFVFSTVLRRVTGVLRQPGYAQMLRGLASEAHDWSGGTRIGECLSTFNQEWGKLVDGRTVVVILSDGWDTGEPALLGAEMEVLRRRSRRVIWLNPLLGSPDYEPLTQGMQAALPHVSVFAPAHNLAALRALERHLLS
ncbi:MAG TPA: VWA domain-containing protein, partial [Myxococcales bacterium]|nr:VWA domain-containing protein [Myxococcales bacterium]